MIASTTMQPSARMTLDSPPPLPAEASKKVSRDWYVQPELAEDSEAKDPMIRLASISQEVQGLFQQLIMLAPQQAELWNQMSQALGQAILQALTQQVAPSGATPGAMAPPMPPPPAAPPGMA